MKNNDMLNALEELQKQAATIKDRKANTILSALYNLVENVVLENARLLDENQTLKDMVNRLKGEQGKPCIKPNKKKDGDISSEKERKDSEKSENEGSHEYFKLDKASLENLKENRISKEVLEQLDGLKGKSYSTVAEFSEAVESIIGSDLKAQHLDALVKRARRIKRNRQPKNPTIQIDREKICAVDLNDLPEDVQFKGYESKVVQDLIIKTDNVKFMRAKYYSPLMKKTWLGKVPIGYEGDFGPHINSYIISMKYVNNMSIPKIREFLNNFGTIISGSYISKRLTKCLDVFHREKAEIYQASLESSSYQQIDDTGCRVDGKNHYTQIVCNPFAMVFFTTERKDRLTILDVLRNFESRRFMFNEETFRLLKGLKVPQKLIIALHDIKKDISFNEQEIQEILSKIFPNPNKGKTLRTRVMEASAIAYYHQESTIQIVELLLCDDAPQFKLITDKLGLCWVHDGRHYKRLKPVIQNHQDELSTFRERYWGFYRDLCKYKKDPSDQLAKSISISFELLFSTKTDYEELNKRIEKSKAKKKELLEVLEHPELPLHNNRSENGARVQKRREDVSLHTKTKEGTNAKDTMMTIVETNKIHFISSFKYIYDRVSQTFKMPCLADLIRAKATRQTITHNSS